MDLGVVVSDITAFAETTLTGFGGIIAIFIGLGLALVAVKSFLRKR